MTKRILTVLALAFPASVASLASAADWPGWRGPGRDGQSKETGLLREWPKEGPKLLWQVTHLGGGYSTPSVLGDRIYIIDSTGKVDETLKALDAGDGHVVWSIPLGKVGNPDQKPSYPGARSTPTVDGGRIYALSSDGDLVAADRASGKVAWKKQVRSDFGGQPGTWAYSESPLIDGEILVTAPGGATATVVGLKKETGEVAWKTALPEADQASYASPLVTELSGVRQYVLFLQKGVVGLEATTGKLLWRYTKTAEGSPGNIPTPIVKSPHVYSGAGRTGGGLAKIVSSEGKLSAEPVYFSPKLPIGIGGSVLVDGHLYGTGNQGLLCADFLTGDLKWQDRGVGAASVLVAEGLLYLHGENGDVALVEANPSGYKEHGRFTPQGAPDRGSSKAWAYPVVADGRLYIRDLSSLWCYDVRAAR